MRKDTILMILGVAIVAVATFFILETTVPQSEPELAAVVPEEPPVIDEEQARQVPEDERVDPTEP